MAPRLLIGMGSEPAFKLAKPGYNVLTASPAQLLFDISESGMKTRGFIGKYLRGSQSVSVGTTEGEKGGTISFGKTFATPPLVFAVLHDPSGQHLMPFNASYLTGSNTRVLYFVYNVSTTQISYGFADGLKNTSSGVYSQYLPTGTYYIHYLVAAS